MTKLVIYRILSLFLRHTKKLLIKHLFANSDLLSHAGLCRYISLAHCFCSSRRLLAWKKNVYLIVSTSVGCHWLNLCLIIWQEFTGNLFLHIFHKAGRKQYFKVDLKRYRQDLVANFIVDSPDFLFFSMANGVSWHWTLFSNSPSQHKTLIIELMTNYTWPRFKSSRSHQ